MNKLSLSFSLMLLLTAPMLSALAGKHTTPRSPELGVLCDRYVCANNNGLSRELTERYLGKKSAAKLVSQEGFDPTEFTFANGIFCDVKERLCRKDRYFGTDGKRSGVVTKKYTELLFGE